MAVARSTRAPVPSRGAPGRGPDRRALGSLAIWATLFAVVVVWGQRLARQGPDLKLGAIPLYGVWHRDLSSRAVPAAVFAVAAVVIAPVVVRRLAWRALLAATAASTGAWAVLLALVEGGGGVTNPLLGRFEYLTFLPRVGDLGEFVRTFAEQSGGYTVHVKTHPPGWLVVLSVLERAGFGGPWPAAVVIIAAYAVGVVAVLVAVRSLADEPAARAAAPFIAFAPAAVYVATTADAFFAGVALAGVAMFTLATASGGRRADVTAAGAGVLLGGSLFLSYGMAVLVVPVVGIAVLRRRLRALLVCGLGVASVMAIFAAAGFWWFEGLELARVHFLRGVGGRRPLGYFMIANVAVFGLVAGPATVGALGRLVASPAIRSRTAVLPLLGLGAVALADLSGMARSEVERIWLFLVPPVAAATALLVRRRGEVPRTWLAGQLATGLVLQTGLVTIW